MGTLVVGLIFAALFIWVGRKAYVDIKKGKCSGCSSCSYAKKNGECG